MLSSTARYPTPNGSKYLQQLCKHFAHKIEVTYDAHQGQALLPSGQAQLSADAEGLTVQVSAEDVSGIIQARFVIDKHLVTFAHREGFSGLSWAMDA